MRIYGLFYITTIIPMHETDNETDLSVYFSVLTTFNSINMEEGGFLKQCCIYLIPLMFCHIAEYKRLNVLSLSLRMQSVGLALEELLVTAQKQGCLTVGIYESAKLLNVWVESINFGLCFSSHCPNWSSPDMWIQVFPHFPSFLFPFRDPDSVVLCVLAADDENDVALQIHFTLLQSFCCDSGITILRVSGFQRLQRLLGAVDANKNQEEHRDLHCMLVTVCWLSIVATSYVTERQMVIFFMHNFQLRYCTFSYSSPCDFYSYFAGSIQIERWTWFFFFSHTESSGRALQTAGSGDLLPGESAPWPVGAWTSPAGTLKGLHTGTFVARYWYTEGSLCSSRDDLECSRSSPLSLMTNKTMGSHSKTSETAGLDTGF